MTKQKQKKGFKLYKINLNFTQKLQVKRKYLEIKIIKTD